MLIIAILFLLACFLCFQYCGSSERGTLFQDYPTYEGSDLGVTYNPEATTFKLWAPSSEAVRLKLYDSGTDSTMLQVHDLSLEENGVWSISIPEDLIGKYYTFQVMIDGSWKMDVPDPYAKAVGVNGKRGMIVDLESTNPENWANDGSPALANPNDAIIYELHMRDLSMHPNSGIQHKGKFLGLTETGTKTPAGTVSGLDHIKALGVTHIHILPSYDYKSVDESRKDTAQFNWGYDPQNYNTPEGSYATDPYDGNVRIKEFKQMVKTLHDNGLRVIMDVVYNHTYDTETSNFNQLVPGYYYRQDTTGGFSDASACGNETASERPMMRKFIVESVKYWVEEYHVDGFRFDLMGIHDIETMNLVSRTLHDIDPTILIYGEGWTAGASPLPDALRALKATTYKLDRIAAFSDDIRDGIRGHVFTPTEKGFVSGKAGLEESIKFGVVASTQHPQVNYAKVNYSKAPWSNHPTQTITYASCHDNHTLWDRLSLNTAEASESERIKMHLLATTIVLTSQGIPFLHAGVEFLRTKGGEENSFESPDSINQIDWDRKTVYQSVHDYIQGLIALRKAHPAFRMPTADLVREHLSFLPVETDNLVAYTLKENANGDEWKEILVAYNGAQEAQLLEVPQQSWTVVVENQHVDQGGIRTITTNKISVPAHSAMILYHNE